MHEHFAHAVVLFSLFRWITAMEYHRLTFKSLALKTIVVHTVTYFVCGIAAFFLLDYERHFAHPEVRVYMRQTDDPVVRAGPLLQPIRGLLFAVAFYPLRSVFFGQKNGWLAMWTVLVTVGIFSTFGPSPGSIEGMIYTHFPMWPQLFGLIEVILQSLLLSLILCYWVSHPAQRWINWGLGLAFAIALCLPAVGLFMGSLAGH